MRLSNFLKTILIITILNTIIFAKEKPLNMNINGLKIETFIQTSKLTYIGVISLYAVAMAILSLFGKSSNEMLNFLIIIPIIGQMLHFYLDSQLWKFSKSHNRENTLKFIKY